jgi:hypothetical protein
MARASLRRRDWFLAAAIKGECRDRAKAGLWATRLDTVLRRRRDDDDIFIIMIKAQVLVAVWVWRKNVDGGRLVSSLVSYDSYLFV